MVHEWVEQWPIKLGPASAGRRRGNRWARTPGPRRAIAYEFIRVAIGPSQAAAAVATAAVDSAAALGRGVVVIDRPGGAGVQLQPGRAGDQAAQGMDPRRLARA